MGKIVKSMHYVSGSAMRQLPSIFKEQLKGKKKRGEIVEGKTSLFSSAFYFIFFF